MTLKNCVNPLKPTEYLCDCLNVYKSIDIGEKQLLNMEAVSQMDFVHR